MRRLLLMPVIALLAVFFTALPASAATVTSFTADGGAADLTITPGTDVTFEYEVEATGDPAGAVTVTAAGDAAGQFDGWTGEVPSGRLVTFPDEGVFTFAVEAAEEGVEGTATSDEIVVTVVEDPAEEPTIIDVPAVTFPEPCVVVLPAVDNVTYGVNYGQSGNEVEPGTYDIEEFLESGIPLEIVAVPAEGFAFPEGADNRFEIPDLEDCFGTIVESGLVETRAICQGVTFTNVADEDLFIVYGDDNDDIDGELELAAGASRTIETDRDVVTYAAFSEAEPVVQVNEVEVEQDCVAGDRRAAFPTVAPAAGESGPGAQHAALGLLGAALLAGAGVAVRRRTA